MKRMKQNKNKILTLCGMILLICLLYGPLSRFMPWVKQPKELGYNDFIALIKKKDIKEAVYSKSDEKFLAKDKKGNEYKVINPQTDEFKEFLLKNDVEVKKSSMSIFEFFSKNSIILNMLILGYVTYKFMSSESFFPSTNMDKAKKKIENIGLDDIIVPINVKKDIKLIIDYLKRPDVYEKKHVKIPNGVLLYGPPGTGKTLMARAIAGEAGCNYYAISGSDLVEMYVGRGAARVRSLFKEAKENSPSVIFIDEIDAIGKKRGARGSDSERDQTINALLNEIDGFENKGDVVVIAATNRLEDLDDALIRSGRFGKHIAVPLPMTKEERLKIINIHKVDEAYTDNVDFEKLAKMTIGYSGADLSSILNESLLISVHHNKEKVDQACLDIAFKQHLVKGHEKDSGDNRNQEELRITAIHEAGHAIAAKLICGESVPMISIIETTSGAGGYTVSLPEEEKAYFTCEMLKNQVKKLYAGRAAETVKGYDVSTGAKNDIERATKILKDMKYKYAMYENVNLEVLYGDNDSKIFVKDIIEEGKRLYDETILFIKQHEEILDEITKILLEKETIEETEIDKILKI